MSNNELVTEITNNFPGLIINRISRVEIGVLSENYVINTNSSRFFLKQNKYADDIRLNEIYKTIEFFGKNGIPIALPIKTVNNSNFFNYKGKRFSLFPYIEGNHIKRGTLNTKQTNSLGYMLAKIHTATALEMPKILHTTGRVEKSINTRCLNIKNLLKTLIENNDKELFDTKVITLLTTKLRLLEEFGIEFDLIMLPKNCIIHGDYGVENVFYNNSDEIINVFDWDSVRIDCRESELVRSLFLTYFETEINTKTIESALAYIDSYQSLCKINKDTFVNAITWYYYGLFRTIWAEDEYYNNNNQRIKNIIINDITRLNYLENNISFLTSKLASVVEK